jgi:hypothetical protein
MFVITYPVEIRESDIPIPAKDPKNVEVRAQESDNLVDHENTSVNRVRIKMNGNEALRKSRVPNSQDRTRANSERVEKRKGVQRGRRNPPRHRYATRNFTESLPRGTRTKRGPNLPTRAPQGDPVGKRSFMM